MKKFFFIFLVLLAFLVNAGCTRYGNEIIKKTNSGNNFYITIHDSDVDNPENDRRCYYIIYVDKIESGRTTIGLESQEKYFETLLPSNRHLIKVEKWILNESLGRYTKMNNIDQPKPDFIYIIIEKNKIVNVKLQSSKSGTATYSMIIE